MGRSFVTGGSATRYRVGDVARMTAVQFADCVDASPGQRRRLVRDVKFPPASPAARYDGAREAIVAFLCDRRRSPDILARDVDALRAHAIGTISVATRQDSLLSIEAIRSFRAAYAGGAWGLPQLVIHSAEAPKTAVAMGETRVAAALDGVVRADARVGGLILLFAAGTTSRPRRVARCRMLATLAHMLLQPDAGALGEPDPHLSVAVDVLGGLACVAGADWQAQVARMTAAGDVIAAEWACAEPPAERGARP